MKSQKLEKTIENSELELSNLSQKKNPPPPKHNNTKEAIITHFRPKNLSIPNFPTSQD
jgi:hypothetical protein